MGHLTLDLADVEAAAARLDGVAHRTPVATSRTLDGMVGGSVLLKCENLQRTGTFKFRGAYSLIASLSEAERAAGVCTVSSGNHAQAVALAGQLLRVPVVVAMPEDAPQVKIEATRGYGAELVFFDRYREAQHDAGERVRAERGMTFVSSHDDPRISAGAGTAMLELVDDAGPFDVVVGPVGGGGGMAGYATVARARCPEARIVAVEPAASRIASRSLEAGERLEGPVPDTIADGQQLRRLGAFPFEVMRRLVDEVVAVTDEEIVSAMRFLFDRMKLVVEPSGASALGAVIAGKVDVEGRRVGVIVSGGNLGTARAAALLG